MDERSAITPQEKERREHPIYVIYPVILDSLVAIDSRRSYESSERPEFIVKRDLLSDAEELTLIAQHSSGIRDSELIRMFQGRVIAKMNVFRPEFPPRASVPILYWDRPVRDFFRTEGWRTVYKAVKGKVDIRRVELMALDLVTQEVKMNVPRP